MKTLSDFGVILLEPGEIKQLRNELDNLYYNYSGTPRQFHQTYPALGKLRNLVMFWFVSMEEE